MSCIKHILFVTNYPSDIKSRDLFGFFQSRKCIGIKSVNMFPGKKHTKPPFSFVQFSSRDEANKALELSGIQCIDSYGNPYKFYMEKYIQRESRTRASETRRGRSQSPTRQRSQSPTRQGRSQSPTRQRSQSPTRQRSQSPTRQRSQSPTRQGRSPSPTQYF
jgi:hypothetical protein